MTGDRTMYVPAGPLPPPRSGVLTPFDPGTRTLEARARFPRLPATPPPEPGMTPMTITESTTTDPSVRLADHDSDAAIVGFELAAAHRALALLKSSLGRERLLDLLQGEIAAGTAYLRESIERSAGEEISGTTTLRAHGITAAHFTGWLAQAFGREDVLLAGHPEHYSIHAAAGRVNIVETLGEHVCSFFMRPYDDAATPAPDDGATHRRRSRMVLDDDTVVGSITNAFHDEPAGFTVHLSVTLPVTCGPDAVAHHLQHFAVEFHNWILRAAAEQSVND